jgi:hypothetical protein
MIFKVKQRGMAKYEDKIYNQVGEKQSKSQATGYQVEYNWPYDYISFVEMVNMDAEALMENVAQQEITTTNIEINKVPETISGEKAKQAAEDKTIQQALNRIDKKSKR